LTRQAGFQKYGINDPHPHLGKWTHNQTIKISIASLFFCFFISRISFSEQEAYIRSLAEIAFWASLLCFLPHFGKKKMLPIKQKNSF
jgi:hypothetical protein